MDKAQFAGEFNLEKCELISSAGISADISGIIVEINIFESIFSNALTGSIILTDTNNLTDNMPIIGQEYISMKISTPGLEGQENKYVYSKHTKLTGCSKRKGYRISWTVRGNKGFTGCSE